MMVFSAYIRQLIYISLFPPGLYSAFGKEKTKDILGSPSKIQSALKHSGAANIPTPASTEAAIRLLTNFTLTNTPQSLLRSFACYPLSEYEKRVIGPEVSGFYSEYKDELATNSDTGDSEIASQASSLLDCKDCWALLKRGVVKWELETNTKGSRKQTRRRQLENPLIDHHSEEEDAADVVEDNA